MRKKTRLFPERDTLEGRTRVERISKHPFIVPVTTLLLLFIITSVAFITLGAHTIEPSDKRVVRLHIDGQSQTVPTRAETVGELLERLNITVTEQDIIEPSVDTPIEEDNFNVNVYTARPVTVVDEVGNPVDIVSAHQEPKDVAEQAGVTVYPEDKVAVKPPEDIFTDGIAEQIVIDRATPANINLYGNPVAARTHVTTVGELLKEKNIAPLEGDVITPAPDTLLTANTQIFIVRLGKQVDTREEKIPAPVETIEDSAVALGTTVVKQAGTDGKKLVTYEVELQNGKEVSRKVLQEVVAIEPVKKIVAKGKKLPNIAIGGDKSAILSQAGVPADQHYAADFIIARESGWRLTARNASGCLGLGQACPGSKLVNACPNWQTDAICQIKFFTGYANSRYGSWVNAYNAWQIKHWW